MGSTVEKNLLECMSEKFLRFDRFIQKKMQAKGNTEEERAREAFLEFRKRTHRAEIASLPTMRRWFGIGSYHRPSREQVIHMCFALELQEEEAQEYLTVGLSEPGFQVNDYQESIFLYGIVNSYSYEESLAMMEQFEESLDKEISFSRNNSTRYLRKDFANTTLNACNMAPLSEKYELDMALLTCFQPEEMYTYPDVLEVLGREE